MADNILKLDIVTPNRLVAELDATEITIPGVLGELGILPGHLPLVTTLRPGILDIKTIDGDNQRLAVSEGFAVVGDNTVTILADTAESSSDVDIELARQAAQDAEDRLSNIQHLEEEDIYVFRKALDRAQTRIKIWEEREKRKK